MLTACVRYTCPFQAFSIEHTLIETLQYHNVIQQLYDQHRYVSSQVLLLGHKEELHHISSFLQVSQSNLPIHEICSGS